MELKDEIELENTKVKLRMLVEHYDARRQECVEETHIRDLSLRSLKRMINQLTEEIIRYEARQREAAKSADKVTAN